MNLIKVVVSMFQTWYDFRHVSLLLMRMLLISPTLQEMGQPVHGGETTWKQRADGRWTDSFGSSHLIFVEGLECLVRK